MRLDFIVTGHGTVHHLTPLTPRAQQWVDDHLDYEQWQLFADGGIAIDHRYVDAIVAGIHEHTPFSIVRR